MDKDGERLKENRYKMWNSKVEVEVEREKEKSITRRPR